MNALKNLLTGIAVTIACSTSAFAQLPFNAWNMGTPMNCQNGVCRPVGNVSNAYGNTGVPMNCQNGVCRPAVNVNGTYGPTTPMNCQNGVCTPAYGNSQTPVRTPALSGIPSNVGGAGNSPYFTPNGPNPFYGVPHSPAQTFPPQNYGLNIPANMSGIAQLPVWEQEAALKQRICPISGDLLGSRGVPIRTVINGQSVFVCCHNCQQNNNTYGNGGLLGSQTSPWFNSPNLNSGYGYPGQASHQNYVLY